MPRPILAFDSAPVAAIAASDSLTSTLSVTISERAHHDDIVVTCF